MTLTMLQTPMIRYWTPRRVTPVAPTMTWVAQCRLGKHRRADVHRRMSPPRHGRVSREQHHWVMGNLSCGSECAVCAELCGDGPGLVDQQCAWCQQTVHTECAGKLGQVCVRAHARTHTAMCTDLHIRPCTPLHIAASVCASADAERWPSASPCCHH
jgi:hypothetical protein